MAFHSFLLCVLCYLAIAEASVTVYYQIPLGHQPTSTPAATASATVGPEPSQTGVYTGLAAYDPTTWPPPPLPNPPPPMQFPIVLLPAADQVGGLSIKIPASFFGFSIEMSVVTQHCECSPFSWRLWGLSSSGDHSAPLTPAIDFRMGGMC